MAQKKGSDAKKFDLNSIEGAAYVRLKKRKKKDASLNYDYITSAFGQQWNVIISPEIGKREICSGGARELE